VLLVRDPKEAQPLNEIRGKVIADYQLKLEEEWLEELKAKYPVVVHQPELLNIYKKIESK
jgi:peptidyl-prolyl cis-trans isomerase SurA